MNEKILKEDILKTTEPKDSLPTPGKTTFTEKSHDIFNT